MDEIQVYNWQTYQFTSDPRMQHHQAPHRDDMMEITPETRPDIYLDGECVNGRVRWCVTGEQGVISLFVKPDGKFVVDPETGRAKTEIRRGRVTVTPRNTV